MRAYVLAASAGFALAATPALAQRTAAELAKQYQDDFNGKNAGELIRLMVANGVAVTPDAGIQKGREAFRADAERRLKAGWHDLNIQTTEDQARESPSWAAGSWSAKVPGPNNAEMPIGGYWSALFAREVGALRIHVLTFNLTPPPPQK